ncbi:rhomboid family intramembrane serine protease [Lentibacter sp. XHP0401]|uniref:rhomboid family intramembrane serine protease n=1 Tax=Lentibacter sp. XHP0401 TaxID=2984334 RepID=UPI0021E754DE|nr:rhomboid family intramembrane serine protease [Lentibacter sp. XHP0401]MCV2894052.1 rhomboid family intramembrane serine protease [Lentibacter sp. XHP0401]
MRNQSPVNDISPVVVVLFAVMVLVEGVFAAAEAGLVGGRMGIGWRVAMIEDYGVFGSLVRWMWERGEWPLEHLLRFVTYPFLHGSFVHMIFAAAIMLALGKYVGDRFRWWAVLVVFFSASILGALAWGLLKTEAGMLIGGYPAAYGLIGAFTYILWLQLRSLGEPQLRAFQLIGFLMVIRLIFGLLFGSDGVWIAEIVGFATGFGVSFLVSPGGFARLREAIRGAGQT